MIKYALVKFTQQERNTEALKVREYHDPDEACDTVNELNRNNQIANISYVVLAVKRDNYRTTH